SSGGRSLRVARPRAFPGRRFCQTVQPAEPQALHGSDRRDWMAAAHPQRIAPSRAGARKKLGIAHIFAPVTVDVAKVLLLDDDTVRTWHRLYEDEGIEGLASFGYDGSACRLSDAQQDKLKSWIAETLPRTTREVGAWIETECG